MDRPEEFDRDLVLAGIARFGDQVERRLAGEITEDQFRPLRRMNGVTLEQHSYMLRVGVPDGALDRRQLRMLAHVARTYDKGYCRFTGQGTVEFQWPALADIPAMLADLATVEIRAAGISADGFLHEAGDPSADAGGLRGTVSAEQLELLADVGAAPLRGALYGAEARAA
jgi:sulfite reductase (NADPH) hemoprotein beta-component